MKKIFLLTLSIIALSICQFAQKMSVIQNMNPLIPFSFTYEYRYPTEWQGDFFLGTSVDPNSISNILSEGSTPTLINTGLIGFKLGLPGDIVFFAGWPWLGGYFSVPENGFFPEFDISINFPLTFTMPNLNAFSESISINAVLKKSLQPFRISGGINFMYSPVFAEPQDGDDALEVGGTFIGLGLEWFVNSNLKLLLEYRYQFSAILYSNEDGKGYKFEIFPTFPNNIIGVGLEYFLDIERYSANKDVYPSTVAAYGEWQDYSGSAGRELEKFTMKISLGYAVSILPPIEGYSIPFGTNALSISASFLFPFNFN